MSLSGLVVIDGGHRICKGEVLFRGVIIARDALLNQIVLVFEHLVNARLTHVPAFCLLPVDGIAEVSIIS